MRLACLFLIVLAVRCGDAAMTEKQMKAAVRLIKNACVPKSKVTEEQIEAMQHGNFDLEKSAMCYVHCVLNYYKLQLPDNSFDWETGIKIIETQAPSSIASFAIDAMKACKDAVKTPGEKCKAAMEIARCIYEFNPEKYFLP
ncbi:general odorant-binding protein 72-like [Anthonomus grandis grandis]|uniref:general odorant-binding protein 72-like n=1 Tax=Anthonomus grandis grandis TaxID=2921223 RepID=UPI0021664890|nr:general odorant-binding protein 72-like [Anthonomus grandis grandis]